MTGHGDWAFEAEVIRILVWNSGRSSYGAPLNHPPMDMSADEEIVRVIAGAYQEVTGNEPRGVGLPTSPLSARYGDDDAHMWLAGIPAPIYGPSGGSYGEDYTLINEMVLCN